MSTSAPHRPARLALAAVTLGALVTACGDDSTTATTAAPIVAQKITVTYVAGSQESELLSSIYGQGLERAGFRVARKNPVADNDALYQAVTADVVQVVPAYTGELLDHLIELDGGDAPVDARGPAEQQIAIQSLLPATLSVASASPALHNDVIACSAEAVAEHRLSSYTSLALSAGEITIGAPEGFETSEPLGLGTWGEVYGTEFREFVPVDPADFATAVSEGTVDCLALASVDPVITAQTMTILDDDQLLVPTQALIPLLSAAAVAEGVVGLLDEVSAAITTQVLNEMMNQIVTEGRSPDVVAKAFLDSFARS